MVTPGTRLAFIVLTLTIGVSAGSSAKAASTNFMPPKDATAKCRDGTFGLGHDPKETCSHHGGVGHPRAIRAHGPKAEAQSLDLLLVTRASGDDDLVAARPQAQGNGEIRVQIP